MPPAHGSAPRSAATSGAAQVRRLRSDTLARKLRRATGPGVRRQTDTSPGFPKTPDSSPGATTPSPADPYDAPSGVAQSTAEVFRDRFDQIGAEVRTRRARKAATDAQLALSRGDYRRAAELYREAVKLAPDDEELARQADKAQRLASRR